MRTLIRKDCLKWDMIPSEVILTHEQHKLLKEVDKACREIRDSEEKSWLNKTFNSERMRVFGKAKLLGIPIDGKYGGRGADSFSNMLCVQRIGREGSALRTFFSVHVNIGQYSIHLGGNARQKRKYLTKTATGKALAAFALTEPSVGSNPSAMKTSFTKKRGNYVLNGRKAWIGNATKADVITLFAKDKRGKISAFVVERDFSGLSSKEFRHKMGYHNSNHGEIILKDCEVPAENLLGKEEDGLSLAYRTLINGRLSVAAGCVGVIEDCLTEAVSYAKKRRQWGEKIGKKQLVQLNIAKMGVNLEAVRGLVNRAARLKTLYDKKPSIRELRDEAEYAASMAKVFGTEASFDAADRAVQIFGSKGYTFENRVARHFVDERATRIYEGTTDINYLKIALKYLGKEYAAFR